MAGGSEARPRDGGTRDRLLSSALELFSSRGFRATTVGEIEAAAGLTPRAGAFYRHFRSKDEVLHVAVETQASGLDGFAELTELLPLGDLRAELTLVVRWALKFLRAQQPLLRILVRDGDRFPDLLARVHERLIVRGYDQAEGVFGELLRNHGRPDAAARGIAAIALGSLVHYVEDEAVYGAPPAGLGEDEFAAAWVDTWSRVIGGETS